MHVFPSFKVDTYLHTFNSLFCKHDQCISLILKSMYDLSVICSHCKSMQMHVLITTHKFNQTFLSKSLLL